jgi:hypothetical protein
MFCVFRLYTMVVTRNSQRSPERSEITSINKLIAKRKEEMRKKKSAKFVDKATTSNVAETVNKGKIIAHSGHEGLSLYIFNFSYFQVVVFLLFVNFTYSFYNYYNRTGCSFC